MKKAILYLITFTTVMSCSSEKSNSQNYDLVGKWKLTAFVNETSGTILRATDFENSNVITIEYKENQKFIGSTVLNDFFGDYSTNTSNDLLIFKNFASTEVNETDWGNLFFEKLNLNYNRETKNWESRYLLSNNVIKLYYSKNEYMKFEKV